MKTCGICSNMGHSTDICHTLQEEPVEQANAVGWFPGMPKRRYNPYAQTHNPGWKDHPNFNFNYEPLYMESRRWKCLGSDFVNLTDTCSSGFFSNTLDEDVSFVYLSISIHNH